MPEVRAFVSDMANPIVIAMLRAKRKTAWNNSSDISFTMTSGSVNEIADMKPPALRELNIEAGEGDVSPSKLGRPVDEKKDGVAGGGCVYVEDRKVYEGF